MTIKFYKVKFTNVLPRGKNETVFNPSVSHWKDNLYLCTFRVFSRYPGINSSDYDKDPVTSPNHPWLGSIEAWPLWWNSVYGYDKTRVVLLRINDELNVTLVNDYGEVWGVDGRLLKIDYDKFIFMYNIWIGKDKNIRIKGNKNCENGCMLIGTRIFTLHGALHGDTMSKGKGRILCPEISHRIEKNWSIWQESDNSLKFSYGLSPTHEIFSLKINKNIIDCDGIQKIHGKVNFFHELEKYYNKIVSISLTTPALLQLNGKFLAVGHLKYKYRHIDYNVNEMDKIIPQTSPYTSEILDSNRFTAKTTHANSPLLIFHKKMIKENKKFHPLLVYMIFLYEFESTPPYNVTRVSPMFIPNSDYTLCFPTNITWSSPLKAYAISYGDHDTSCNMLVLTPKEINDSLEPLVSPEKVRFMMVN